MDAAEEIRSRLSIEDVIGEYLELKRSGRNFKANSPWTNEKTPSFMISPEKQIWHDFSSGRGGNMFSFVMEMEGVDFKGALEILARKAGVDLSQYSRGTDFSKQKEKLYQILELATKYYQASLVKNHSAVEYVSKKRGFNRQTIEAFQLGYAPHADHALVDFLKKQGFTESDIKKAGLGVQRRSFSDMFRGRIMIPLADAQGRVIGFTARLLQDEPGAPKYINTPQTLLYDKGKHVYGLHLAKEAIRQTKYVVVAEGNLDVISSWQSGVRQVVATAGTAMTENHLKVLARFTNDVRLAYDQDQAGLNATERSIPLAQKIGVQLSMITISGAKDPDELIKKDQTKWASAVDSPKYVVDWILEQYRTNLDLSSATGKRQFTDIVLKIISRLKDPVEQDHYLKKMAQEVDITEDALRAKLNGMGEDSPQRLRKKNITEGQNEAPPKDENIYEDNFLCLVAAYPLTRRVFETTPVEIELSTQQRQHFLGYVLANLQISFTESLPEDLPTDEDYVKMLLFKAEQLYDKLDSNERLREAQVLLTRIREQNNKQQNRALAKAIADAEARGDKAAIQTLLKELNDKIKKQNEV